MPESLPVTFGITDLDPGGAERALVEIVTRLRPRGFEPRVIALSGPGELVASLEAAGVPVECLGATSGRSLSVIGRLTDALRRHPPCLLQTFMFHANLAGRWAARRAGVPIVVCGLRVAERDAPWRMRLDRWTQRFVTHNVAVSQGVADFAVREIGLAAAKVSVIQNGVDLARFADAVPADLGRFGIPSGARVILFVGRLHPQKAPDVLLRGALPVLTAQPDVHLLFVGDGPLRAALEREASGTLAASRIHFAGRQEDVPGLLRAATVCVLPSRWEGMPNVVLEAMAAGCPVLATDVEGTREVVRPGETGWLLPCDSVPALQAGLVDSLGNASLRSSLARAAQGLVSKEFTWGSVANQYADLYGRLLQRSPRC